MWFAASSSMEQYLAQYQQSVVEQLPKGSQFTIGRTSFSAKESSGELAKIKLSIPVNETEHVSLSIDSMEWQYQKRSLKKAVVIVDNVSLYDVEVTLPQGNSQQAIAQVSAHINKMLEQAVSTQVGINGNKEFSVSVANVAVEKLFVMQVENSTPIQESIFTKQKLDSSNLADEHIMSVAGAKIIVNVLQLAQQKLNEQ